jgi:hypothetical protein
MPAPAAAAPSPQAVPAGPPPAAIGADLGPNLWQGSQLSQLMALVPQLPAPVTVPALRDLQLRLLTTNATAGSQPGQDPLVPLRAERLNAMGFADAALALTSAAVTQAPATPEQAVEQALRDGNTAGACGQVDDALGKMESPDLYWRKALIFCQLSRQQTDQAQLGLDLLRETPNPDADTRNFLAVAAVATGDATVKSIKKPIVTEDPVLTALMQVAGLPAPKPRTNVAPRAVGLALAAATARDGSQQLPVRIEAAERAFAAGLVTLDELTALYQQAPMPQGDPVAGISASDSPMTRAALYKATSAAAMPDLRARLIGAAIQRARARGDYLIQATIYAPFAQQVQPARNITWFAPEAARLMFFSGNFDRGRFWLNIVDTAVANPDLARQAPGLRLLARIARNGGAAMGNDPVAAWRQATGAAERPGAQIYAIFAGLGQKIGGWTGIAPITTGAGYASRINAAAVAGRRGETLLLSLVALGGDRVAAAEPDALATAIGGMTSVGLGREARQVALEAALSIGL